MGSRATDSRRLLDQILEQLRLFFKDESKVDAWMTTKNPLLGNTSPADMFLAGRGAKLLAFIEQQLRNND